MRREVVLVARRGVDLSLAQFDRSPHLPRRGPHDERPARYAYPPPESPAARGRRRPWPRLPSPEPAHHSSALVGQCAARVYRRQDHPARDRAWRPIMASRARKAALRAPAPVTSTRQHPNRMLHEPPQLHRGTRRAHRPRRPPGDRTARVIAKKRLPGTTAPPWTTGASRTCPTAGIAPSGGLITAANWSIPNMPRVRDREGPVLRLFRLELARPRPRRGKLPQLAMRSPPRFSGPPGARGRRDEPVRDRRCDQRCRRSCA